MVAVVSIAAAPPVLANGRREQKKNIKSRKVKIRGSVAAIRATWLGRDRWYGTGAKRLYCRDVRTVHSQLHLGANSRALSPHGAVGDSKPAAALQCLPDRSGGHDCRARRQ